MNDDELRLIYLDNYKFIKEIRLSKYDVDIVRALRMYRYKNYMSVRQIHELMQNPSMLIVPRIMSISTASVTLLRLFRKGYLERILKHQPSGGLGEYLYRYKL